MYNCYEMRINDFIRRCDYILHQNNNIIGIGLGNKVINGNSINVPTLSVLVKKKVLKSDLARKDIIPRYVSGILTDVIEGGEIITCDSKVRPTYGGVSISANNEKVNLNNYGTIAYAVMDRETKSKVYILSCLHVLTSNFTTNVKGSIVQPALLFDKNRAENNIAKISKIVSLDPKATDDAHMNEVDAGIAIVGGNTEITFKNFIQPRLSDGTVIKKIEQVKRGDKIWKIGAQTGKTFGKIVIENFKAEVVFGNEKMYFKNQIVADCKVEDGDSGALGVVTTGTIKKENNAFGMLMASAGKCSIFNPIDRVLDLLEVDLLVFN